MAEHGKEANFGKLLQTRIQEHHGMELNYETILQQCLLWTISQRTDWAMTLTEPCNNGIHQKGVQMEPWEDGYLGTSRDILNRFSLLPSSGKADNPRLLHMGHHGQSPKELGNLR